MNQDWVKMKHDQVIEKLESKFGDNLQETVRFRDELTVIVHSNVIREMVSFLKSDPDLTFNFLSDLTAVDNLAVDNLEEPRFEVVYHLLSFANNTRLRVKVRVSAGDPKIDSITPVFKGANWFEREVFDMFGIKFEGHPDLRRILNPETFPGHPLRKDFNGGPSDSYCPVPIREEKQRKNK